MPAETLRIQLRGASVPSNDTETGLNPWTRWPEDRPKMRDRLEMIATLEEPTVLATDRDALLWPPAIDGRHPGEEEELEDDEIDDDDDIDDEEDDIDDEEDDDIDDEDDEIDDDFDDGLDEEIEDIEVEDDEDLDDDDDDIDDIDDEEEVESEEEL